MNFPYVLSDEILPRSKCEKKKMEKKLRSKWLSVTIEQPEKEEKWNPIKTTTTLVLFFLRKKNCWRLLLFSQTHIYDHLQISLGLPAIMVPVIRFQGEDHSHGTCADSTGVGLFVAWPALGSTARMTWRSWKLAFQVSKMSRKGCSRSIETTWPTILFIDSLVNWVNCPKWIAHVEFLLAPNFLPAVRGRHHRLVPSSAMNTGSSLEPFGAPRLVQRLKGFKESLAQEENLVTLGDHNPLPKWLGKSVEFWASLAEAAWNSYSATVLCIERCDFVWDNVPRNPRTDHWRVMVQDGPRHPLRQFLEPFTTRNIQAAVAGSWCQSWRVPKTLCCTTLRRRQFFFLIPWLPGLVDHGVGSKLNDTRTDGDHVTLVKHGWTIQLRIVVYSQSFFTIFYHPAGSCWNGWWLENTQSIVGVSTLLHKISTPALFCILHRWGSDRLTWNLQHWSMPFWGIDHPFALDMLKGMRCLGRFANSFGHVWPCLAMFGHVWPCLAMFGHVWPWPFGWHFIQRETSRMVIFDVCIRGVGDFCGHWLWALALQGDQQQSEDLVRVPGCRVWSCTSQCRGREFNLPGLIWALGELKYVEIGWLNSWSFLSVGPYWAIPEWILMDFEACVDEFWWILRGTCRKVLEEWNCDPWLKGFWIFKKGPGRPGVAANGSKKDKKVNKYPLVN